MPIYRLNSNGYWRKLSRIYRLNSTGNFKSLAIVYRLTSTGIWQKIFGSSVPAPTIITAPVMQSQISRRDEFYGEDVLTLTRGSYTNTSANPSNVRYRMVIYKIQTSGSSTSPSSNLNNWNIAFTDATVISASVNTTTNTIQYTTSTAHNFYANTIVSVTGMTINAFNITDFNIQSVTSNTFTVAVGSSGASGSLSSQSGNARAKAEFTYLGTNSTETTELKYKVSDDDAKNIQWFTAAVFVNNQVSTPGSQAVTFRTESAEGVAQTVLSRMFFEANSFTVDRRSTTASFSWNITGIPDVSYMHQDLSNTASVVRVQRLDETTPFVDFTANIGSLIGTAQATGLTPNIQYKANLIIRGNDGWKTDNNFTKSNKGAVSLGLTYLEFQTFNTEPVNTSAPVVSPVNNRGRWPINTTTNTTLSITTGTWTNLSTPTYSYKWEYLDGSTWITQSNTSTVNFSNALNGFNARCTVRATNSDGGYGEVVVSGILDAGPTVSTITPTSTQPNVSTTFSYTITGYPTSYSIDWGDLSTPYSSGTINAGSSSTITGATTLTSPARIVYTCNNNFVQGMKVTITGVNPNGYNISDATILDATATTFTILGTPGAAYISGGTATGDSSIIYGNVLKTYTTAATRTATITANPASKQSTTSITIQELPPGPLIGFTRQLASLNNVATDKRFTWTAPNTGGSITKYQYRINSGSWGSWLDVSGGNTATQLDLFNFLIEAKSSSGTIGTVSGSFTATITGMSSTTGFFVGQTITAIPGTGSFGSGTMTVTSIVSSTSITVSSSATFTAGTVTNIIGAISHTVEVRAVGPGGNGTASSSGPFNLPAILTGPAVTSIQDTTAFTSWTRSNNVTSGTLTLSPTITGSPFSVGTNTSQSLTTLTANTTYTATLDLGSSTSDTHRQTASFTTLQPRLNPTFSAITKTSDGYTGSVNNYNSSYTYNTPSTIFGDLSLGTWTWGTPSGSNYPFTVSGLTSGQSASATVTTTRSGYATGSANISGTALFSALTPTFGTLTSGSNRIDSSVTNYNANWSWSGSASVGTFAFGTASGSTYPFSVTGLSNGQSTTVTITTTRTDYVQGSNSQSGSALATGLTPSFGTNTSGTNGFAGSVTNYNDSYNWFNSVSVGTFTWGTVPSGGIGTRTFSVTGLSAGQSSTVTITTTRTGFLNGSNSTTGSASLATGLTPTFGTLTSGDGRIDSSVTNYDANYSWSLTASVGTVSPTTFTGTGTTKTFSVTGLTDGQGTTVTVTTTRTGYTQGSNSQSGSALAAGLTPTFGANTSGTNLFAGSVTNYNTDYGWASSLNPITATFTWGSLPATNPGTRTFTVGNLSAGASATLTLTTSRSGFKNGSASTTGSAQAGLTVPGTPTMTYDSASSTQTNWAYDIRFTPSSGSGTIQYQLECRGPSPTPTTTVTRPSTAGTYYPTNIVSTLQEIQNVFLARTITTWQCRARATNDNGSTFTNWSDWSNFA